MEVEREGGGCKDNTQGFINAMDVISQGMGFGGGSGKGCENVQEIVRRCGARGTAARKHSGEAD